MQLINELQQQITGFEPKTSGQYILHAETTKQFYEFLEFKAERRYNATSGIPEIMWFVVLLGAFLTVFLVWLFNMSLIAQLFLGGLLSFFIGIMVSLIVVLDRPLRGDFGISPEVFELLLKFMNNMLATGDTCRWQVMTRCELHGQCVAGVHSPWMCPHGSGRQRL